MSLKMQIVRRDEGDSDDFVRAVEEIVHAVLRADAPADLWVVRIDTWFSQRWRHFVGKELGAYGWARRDRLVIPPFVPSRVVSTDHYATRDGQRVWVPNARPLHVEQTSGDNASRFVDRLSEDALLVWYSGQSNVNGRGAIMVYRVVGIEQSAWYSELLESSAGWRPSCLAGISPEEIAGWMEP